MSRVRSVDSLLSKSEIGIDIVVEELLLTDVAVVSRDERCLQKR
jgi:hypothetical protein